MAEASSSKKGPTGEGLLRKAQDIECPKKAQDKTVVSSKLDESTSILLAKLRKTFGEEIETLQDALDNLSVCTSDDGLIPSENLEVFKSFESLGGLLNKEATTRSNGVVTEAIDSENSKLFKETIGSAGDVLSDEHCNPEIMTGPKGSSDQTFGKDAKNFEQVIRLVNTDREIGVIEGLTTNINCCSNNNDDNANSSLMTEKRELLGSGGVIGANDKPNNSKAHNPCIVNEKSFINMNEKNDTKEAQRFQPWICHGCTSKDYHESLVAYVAARRDRGDTNLPDVKTLRNIIAYLRMACDDPDSEEYKLKANTPEGIAFRNYYSDLDIKALMKICDKFEQGPNRFISPSNLAKLAKGLGFEITAEEAEEAVRVCYADAHTRERIISHIADIRNRYKAYQLLEN